MLGKERGPILVLELCHGNILVTLEVTDKFTKYT